MRTLRQIMCGATLLTIASFIPISAEAQVYSGPKCLGPVCFDGVSSFDGLAKELGGPSSGGGIYGYRTNDGQAFLIITDGGQGKVGSIDLRDFAEFGMWTEKDGKRTTQDIRNWRTLEGIDWEAKRRTLRRHTGSLPVWRTWSWKIPIIRRAKDCSFTRGNSTAWSGRPAFASAMEEYLLSNWRMTPSLGLTAWDPTAPMASSPWIACYGTSDCLPKKIRPPLWSVFSPRTVGHPYTLRRMLKRHPGSLTSC